MQRRRAAVCRIYFYDAYLRVERVTDKVHKNNVLKEIARRSRLRYYFDDRVFIVGLICRVSINEAGCVEAHLIEIAKITVDKKCVVF